MQLLTSDNDAAKVALARIAAFFYQIHQPYDPAEFENPYYNRKFPPIKISKNISSDIRLTQEAYYIAENISSVLCEVDTAETYLSTGSPISEFESKIRNRLDVGASSSRSHKLSSPEFQERSLHLLKSLMTQSTLLPEPGSPVALPVPVPNLQYTKTTNEPS